MAEVFGFLSPCCEKPYQQVGITGPAAEDAAGFPIAYVDQNGDPIPDGVTVTNYFSADGVYRHSVII